MIYGEVYGITIAFKPIRSGLKHNKPQGSSLAAVWIINSRSKPQLSRLFNRNNLNNIHFRLLLNKITFTLRVLKVLYSVFNGLMRSSFIIVTFFTGKSGHLKDKFLLNYLPEPFSEGLSEFYVFTASVDASEMFWLISVVI